MSKIDKYNEIKYMNNIAIKSMRKALGYYEDRDERNNNNDKHIIRFSERALTRNNFVIYLDMSYGYYGDSSSYSVNSTTTNKYILTALNSMARDIVIKAKQLAEDDIIAARNDCREEAAEILASLEEENE